MKLSRRHFLATTAATLVVASGCGSGDSREQVVAANGLAGDEAEAPTGIRLVTADHGSAILGDAPENLVILDVRTAEEFAEGHLEGAVMLDFYREDFADQLATLDPDVPYLLYCRSGNRSGQTAAIMEQLGFADVADVDGGIVAWTEAGLATVTE